MILPYLHERKIYLNKMTPNHNYFYTCIKEYDLEEDQMVNYMVSIDTT